MNLFYKAAMRINGLFAGFLGDTGLSKYLAGTLHFAIRRRPPLSKYTIRKNIYPHAVGAYPLLDSDQRQRIYGWFEMIKKIKDIRGEIVEAGTGYGNTALTLSAANRFLQTEKKIYCFDSFTGFPSPHDFDSSKRVVKGEKLQGWSDTSPEILSEATEHDPALQIYPGYFENTMKFLPEGIALLHLDSDLYESTKVVLEAAYSKLSPGAIVILDEYHDENWPGVKKCVDEFLISKPEELIYFSELMRFGFIKLNN